MLRFVCDYCGSEKKPTEVWINGIAAENVGTQAARREVLIDAAWKYERAVLPLAVHFCSVQCKDDYVTELFDQHPSLLEVERVEIVPGSGRVVHARKKPATAKVTKKTAVRARTRKR